MGVEKHILVDLVDDSVVGGAQLEEAGAQL
jgi:hypothetical protein